MRCRKFCKHVVCNDVEFAVDEKQSSRAQSKIKNIQTRIESLVRIDIISSQYDVDGRSEESRPTTESSRLSLELARVEALTTNAITPLMRYAFKLAYQLTEASALKVRTIGGPVTSAFLIDKELLRINAPKVNKFSHTDMTCAGIFRHDADDRVEAVSFVMSSIMARENNWDKFKLLHQKPDNMAAEVIRKIIDKSGNDMDEIYHYVRSHRLVQAVCHDFHVLFPYWRQAREILHRADSEWRKALTT